MLYNWCIQILYYVIVWIISYYVIVLYVKCYHVSLSNHHAIHFYCVLVRRIIALQVWPRPIIRHVIACYLSRLKKLSIVCNRWNLSEHIVAKPSEIFLSVVLWGVLDATSIIFDSVPSTVHMLIKAVNLSAIKKSWKICLIWLCLMAAFCSPQNTVVTSYEL